MSTALAEKPTQAKESEQEHLVLKFGGSSVADAEKITHVVELIRTIKTNTKAQVSVVFSAMGRIRNEEGVEVVQGTTDQLKQAAQYAAEGNKQYHEVYAAICKRHLDAVHDLLGEHPLAQSVQEKVKQGLDRIIGLLRATETVEGIIPHVLDEILSFGERLSTYIISAYMQSQDMDANFVNAADLVVTDEEYGNAEVQFEETNTNIQTHYKERPNAIQCITGFIGRSLNGKITTLGRGASDYMASIFGAALAAKGIEIWTDVDGFMTCDPRRVKKAMSIEHLTYTEAMEMSGFGSKVLQFHTMIPAMEAKVPITIKNTTNPAFKGTVISDEPGLEVQENGIIKGVTTITDVHLMTLKGAGMRGNKGTAEQLFRSLREAGANVILISQASSENTISFAIDKEHSVDAQQMIAETFAEQMERGSIKPLEVQEERSIVAIVGDKMHDKQGVAARFFTTLTQNGINNIAFTQGSDQRNISTVVEKKDLSKALNALHDEYFVDAKTLNLIVIGPGGVGATLLKQIRDQHQETLEKEGLDLQVRGVANSRETHWDFEEGIELDEQGAIVSKSSTTTEPTDLEELFERVSRENLANTIVVDATANPEVAALTSGFLWRSIAVVAANKSLMTGSLENWINTLVAAKEGNTVFDFETNVGAALPILKTLRDIVGSGNAVKEIFAIPSGTLSALFNEYDGSKPFSRLVREKMNEGITEPDPRKDLNGKDVAGKILILSRIAGMMIEPEAVQVESLINQACEDAEDIEAFFTELEKLDEHFKNLYQQAKEDGKVLRYVAQMKEGKVTVGLQKVEATHLASRLEGTENLFQFVTSQSKRPITIIGAGAGRTETADGLHQGIINIGKR